MQPRVSTRWFSSVIAAMSGLVLLLAVATPAASAGPAGSRGCGRRATCQQEAKRLADLLTAIIEARQAGISGQPGAGVGASSLPKSDRVHIVVHIKPVPTAVPPQDADDVVVVLRLTMNAPNGRSPGSGGITPGVVPSPSPSSTGLLNSLLNSLLGNTTNVTNGVVTTTTGVLNSLLGVTASPTPTPTPTPTRTEPSPSSSDGQPPPGQPSTGPASGSSSQLHLQTAPLQGPSLPPSRGNSAPATHSTSHHAGGVSLNPVSLLSSPSTAILVAAVAAFAVAVFGMVYGAGHRSTGRRRHRARRAR